MNLIYNLRKDKTTRNSVKKIIRCKCCGHVIIASWTSVATMCKDCRSRLWAEQMHQPENIKKNLKHRRKNCVEGYYYKKGQDYEHRLVMEEYLGRKLTADEIVHHIDGNTHNNDISNLCIMSRSDHMKLHHQLRKKCAAS